MSKDAGNKFDDSEIYSIKKLISESNTQVRHDHSQIDTSDKSLEVNSGDASPFVSFASTRKEYTYKHFSSPFVIIKDSPSSNLYLVGITKRFFSSKL